MTSVLVIAEHPDHTTGFATVAANVAAQLTDRGHHVRYLSRGRASGSPASNRPFVVDTLDGAGELADAVRHHARDPQVVLCFGRGGETLELDRHLRAAGVRGRCRLVYYAALEHVPVTPDLGALTTAVDQVVPATAYAAHALAMAPSAAVPHGVDTDRFRPLPAPERAATRAAEFGATDELIVGYVGRNSGHKRPDHALRVFAHLATGAYVTCRSCGTLTVAELGADARFHAPARCRTCRGDALTPGQPRDDARMVMHTELLDRRARRHSRGFDLELLARRLGITDKVWFDRTLRVGSGVPAEQLAQRMAALDVHLMLHQGAGWELTVLETAACGVPNIVTDYAGPAEYAGPFSRLVPVAAQILQPWGVEGIADLDDAVAALVDLGSSPARRATLGANGPAVAARHSWERIGRQWNTLVESIAR